MLTSQGPAYHIGINIKRVLRAYKLSQVAKLSCIKLQLLGIWESSGIDSLASAFVCLVALIHGCVGFRLATGISSAGEACAAP